MHARLNLSMISWYHLSVRDGVLGCVETQTQRAMVRVQDQMMSRLPRSELDGTQPTASVEFVICERSSIVVRRKRTLFSDAEGDSYLETLRRS